MRAKKSREAETVRGMLTAAAGFIVTCFYWEALYPLALLVPRKKKL
jgi:hypothetical protein